MVVESFDVPSVFEPFNMLLVKNFINIKQNRHGINKLIINALGIKWIKWGLIRRKIHLK